MTRITIGFLTQLVIYVFVVIVLYADTIEHEELVLMNQIANISELIHEKQLILDNLQKKLFNLSSYTHIDNKYSNLFKELTSIMETYITQHSIDVLRNESSEVFCRRKFVVNRQFTLKCGDSFGIGNEIGSFMSNVVYAVITNRTVMFNHHDIHAFQSIAKTCDDALTLHDWIPIFGEVKDFNF